MAHRELCLVSVDATHSRLVCDTHECLRASEYHVRANALKAHGFDVCGLLCGAARADAPSRPLAEHAPCTMPGECGADMTCLPTDTGGACERCRTHRDPSRATCSFIPPTQAALECATRLGLAAVPPSVQTIVSDATHGREAYDGGRTGAAALLEGVDAAVHECMRTLDRTQTGCCQGEACVPLTSDVDAHAHVMGRCEPVE